MTQTSQVDGDALWLTLVFSFSALLQDNVYVKSVSVAGTKPRITWQKPQVIFCPCNGMGTEEGDDLMFAGSTGNYNLPCSGAEAAGTTQLYLQTSKIRPTPGIQCHQNSHTDVTQALRETCPSAATAGCQAGCPGASKPVLHHLQNSSPSTGIACRIS